MQIHPPVTSLHVQSVISVGQWEIVLSCDIVWLLMGVFEEILLRAKVFTVTVAVAA
jgi:hypothetical protein